MRYLNDAANFSKITLTPKEIDKLVEYEVDHKAANAILNIYNGPSTAYEIFKTTCNTAALNNINVDITSLITINNILLTNPYASIFGIDPLKTATTAYQPRYTSDILINVLCKIAVLAQKHYNDTAINPPLSDTDKDSIIKIVYAYLQARENKTKYDLTIALPLLPSTK